MEDKKTDNEGTENVNTSTNFFGRPLGLLLNQMENPDLNQPLNPSIKDVYERQMKFALYLLEHGYQKLRFIPEFSPRGYPFPSLVTLSSNIERYDDWCNCGMYIDIHPHKEFYDWIYKFYHLADDELLSQFLKDYPELREKGLGRDENYYRWFKVIASHSLAEKDLRYHLWRWKYLQQAAYELSGVLKDRYMLQRFIRAQDQDGMYDKALSEIREGHKRTNWIWYVFPQYLGLGDSRKAKDYGITDMYEAYHYLQHPILHDRLVRILEALLEHKGEDIVSLMGTELDALKLRSSMTMFAQSVWYISRADDPIRGNSIFKKVIDTFFNGTSDPLTSNMGGGVQISKKEREYIKSVNALYDNVFDTIPHYRMDERLDKILTKKRIALGISQERAWDLECIASDWSLIRNEMYSGLKK